MELRAPVDLVFQSIGGTEGTNRSFGVSLKLLEEARAAALLRHPNIVPKNGYHTPVRANAKPRIASNPEYRVRNPMASIAAMVNNDSFTVAKARP